MLMPPAAADQLEASETSDALFMTQCRSSQAAPHSLNAVLLLARMAFVMHCAHPRSRSSMAVYSIGQMKVGPAPGINSVSQSTHR